MLNKDKLLEYLSLGDRINFFGKVFSDMGITDKVFEDGYTFHLPPCVEQPTDELVNIIRQAYDGPIVIVNNEYSRASHASQIDSIIMEEGVEPSNVIWIHNGMNFPDCSFISIDIPMLTAIHERNFMWDLLTKGFDRPKKNQLPKWPGSSHIGWRYPYTYLPGSSISPEKTFLYLWFKGMQKKNGTRIFMDNLPNLEDWSLVNEQMISKSDCTDAEITAMKDIHDAEYNEERLAPEDWMYNWFEARHQIAWWSKIPVARVDEQEAATYFNIIRETMPMDQVQCFSEKTFKPILFGSMFVNPFLEAFDWYMSQYGIEVMPNVKYITEHKTMMTRLRAMIDFVNYNNFDLMEKHYNENIDIIEQNYNHVISGDFFHLIMNRIDQYV